MSGYCICIGKECTAKRTHSVPTLAEKVVQSKEVEALASEWAQKDPNKTSEQIFLTIKVKDRDGRRGRNPKSGESIYIEQKKVPFFKAGKELKERVNNKVPADTPPTL